MTLVTATRPELIALQAVDAKLGGLPLPGRIWPPGGRAKLGDGVTDTTGWTTRRYDVDAKALTYPADNQFEVALLDPKAESVVGKAALTAAKALVKPAAPAPAPEPEAQDDIPSVRMAEQ